MLESLKRLLGSSVRYRAEPESASLQEDVQVAVCALLLELVYADAEFSDHERHHLQSSIRSQFGLEEAEAEKLLGLAEKARDASIDLWQFTNLIAQNYSADQKKVLSEIMWVLVYSDGELSPPEAYLMRKICYLLRVERRRR